MTVRSKKEEPMNRDGRFKSKNSRWQFDLNTLLLSMFSVLFSALLGGLYLAIDGRIDAVDGKFDSVNSRIDDLSRRVETGFQAVNDRINRLEERINHVEEKIDKGHQNLYDLLLKQQGGRGANHQARALMSLPEAEKLLTPEIKAQLDSLYVGPKVKTQSHLVARIIGHVEPIDIRNASAEKRVPLDKVISAMAAYVAHTRNIKLLD